MFNKDEQKRRCQLLHHLRTSRLNDVPFGLLLEPSRDMQPYVRLVAENSGTWQVYLRQFTLIELIRAAIMFLIGLASLLATLSSLLKVNLAPLWTISPNMLDPIPALFTSTPWLEALFQQVLMPIGLMLMGVIVLVFILFLLGRLSCTWNSLTLDLNSLYCTLAKGPKHVWWWNVNAVSPFGKAWIRMWLEDHTVLLVRVSPADRD